MLLILFNYNIDKGGNAFELRENSTQTILKRKYWQLSNQLFPQYDCYSISRADDFKRNRNGSQA